MKCSLHFLLSIFCSNILLFARAQQPVDGSLITIRIIDDTAHAIEGVTVSLIMLAEGDHKDSTVVATTISGASGAARFVNLAPGRYVIVSASIGYIRSLSDPFTLKRDTTLVLPDIIMVKDYQTLKKAMVGSKKPYIERMPGKIVLHIESNIMAAGSSAFEVLEKAPNVSVDQTDNISIRGKAGVLIMIDGKPTQMAGLDLANMLRSMPANAIDNIEIITNPAAKYDAAGNAGIINIHLKKGQHMGFSGTFNAGYSQGFYAKTNEGVNFNYRHKKVNIFGSYNYSYRKSFVNPNLYRVFLQGDTVTGAYRQKDEIIFPLKTNMERLGVDYYLNSKTIAGVLFNGIQNPYTWWGDNFSDVFDGAGNLQSTFTTASHSANRFDNFAYNANLKHTFDSLGTVLTVDLDYAPYHSNSVQMFTTDYFNPDGTTSAPESVLFGTLPGNLHIRSLNADYTHPTRSGSKLEAGLKASYVNSDNDITFYDSTAGSSQYDSGKSNHFIYQEYIAAGYLTYHGKHKALEYEAGLRAERTRVKGNQLVGSQVFDTTYLQFFPNLSITYKLSVNHQLGLSVGRRIERPTYKQLNPFKFYIDPTTYTQGNPSLHPQTTWNFEVSHSFKEKLTTTLSYSATKDNITEVLAPSPTENKVTIQTNTNLELVQYFYFDIAYTSQIASWWNSTSDCAVYYGSYKGDLANTSLNNGNLTFNLNSNNSFVLGRGYNAELNFFYRAHEVYGFYDLKPVWQLSAGIQKGVFKNKGTIKFNLSDIFYSNFYRGSTTYKDYFESFVTYRDTRIAGVSLSYRFGKTGVAPARRRTGGAESLKSRASNNGQ